MPPGQQSADTRPGSSRSPDGGTVATSTPAALLPARPLAPERVAVLRWLQSFTSMRLPAGYSNSHSLRSVKPSFRQIALEGAIVH